ncbi:MAG: dihydrodipicolinate synthase family protein [Candidatus Flexifilum sp.]
MPDQLLRGVIPILPVPFHPDETIDEDGLRAVVRAELALQPQGIGIGGFASEAYKMTDAERLRCAAIVADEVAGRVPLIIGLSPGGTAAAIEQARQCAAFAPAALMTLPPATMHYPVDAVIDHYVRLAEDAPAPIMIQMSPHLPGYAHTGLDADALATIAERAPNVRYFKIEGAESARRIGALRQRVGDRCGIFGGVGGIALVDELAAGADGVLPGVGFNPVFHRAWAAWEAGRHAAALEILRAAGPLIDAVSGRGHEFSLHARKHLLRERGIISAATVRCPTVSVTAADREAVSRAYADWASA